MGAEIVPVVIAPAETSGFGLVARSFVAIALNGFREARRNRVTLVVGFFAGALVLFAALLTGAVVTTFDRVVVDVGLGTMSLMLALLAIYLSAGLLGREIERRTIFLMVARPVSRTTFLCARLAGNILTLTAVLLLMAIVLGVVLALTGTPFSRPVAVALFGLWLELLVLTSIGFVFSSFASQMVSGFAATALYFAGHLAKDIYNLANKADGGLRALGKAVYYLLPNLDRLNFRPRATYGLTTTLAELGQSTLYAFAYAAALTLIASLLFERRDFR